jgi:hypothetical protein
MTIEKNPDTKRSKLKDRAFGLILQNPVNAPKLVEHSTEGLQGDNWSVRKLSRQATVRRGQIIENHLRQLKKEVPTLEQN